MPQLQVVDTTERAPEPTGVQEFFSKLGKSYKDQSDRVEIGKILNEYKQNRNDANAWENAQLDLQTSNVSPSKRLETQEFLNQTQKAITERDKALNTKIKGTQKNFETQQGLLGAKDILKNQQKLIDSGHIGPKVAFTGTGRKLGSTFSPEGIKARSDYEQSGKSLIQYATNIPIRNRLEFETLAEKLYDPNLKKEEAQGVHDAMQRIIDNSLAATGYSEEKQQAPQASKISEGQTATGPNGQKIVFKGGKWQPM